MYVVYVYEYLTRSNEQRREMGRKRDKKRTQQKEKTAERARVVMCVDYRT